MYGTSSLRPAARGPEVLLQAPGPPSAASRGPSPGRRPCRPPGQVTRARSGPAGMAPLGATHAIAWADSRRTGCPLGPGQRANASSTSASVTAGTRPDRSSPRYECSGPTPGDRARPTPSAPPRPGRARPAGSSSDAVDDAGRPWPMAAPPAGSAPTRRACVSTNPANMPGCVGAAADAGDHDVGVVAQQLARHCSRASSPMTALELVTIHGYGCGPITEPRQ